MLNFLLLKYFHFQERHTTQLFLNSMDVFTLLASDSSQNSFYFHAICPFMNWQELKTHCGNILNMDSVILTFDT